MVQHCSPSASRCRSAAAAAQLLLVLLAAAALCCRCCVATVDRHHQQQQQQQQSQQHRQQQHATTAGLGRRLARSAGAVRLCDSTHPTSRWSTRLWWSPRRRQLLAAADDSSEALQLSSNSTNSTANGTYAVGKPLSDGPQNPWYDQHLLSTGAGGWGSGLLYGSIGSSSSSSSAPAKVSLEAEDDAAATAGSVEQAAMPDPPAYEYPPALRYPTVFFTAVMHGRTTGLSTEEQVAFSAAINAFLAPAPGSITTNTSVLALAAADSGLWVPAATAILTADASALQDFLAGTLQSDPNLVLPTGMWGALRTTNVRVVQPSLANSVRHAWNVGEYSNCSALCGGGSQMRSVTCLDSFGNAADASMCGGAAPPSARACQTQPCQGSLPSDFALALGQWGPCNRTCNYGSRTRSATCVSKEGYVASLSSCNVTLEELVQQLWQPCALPRCPTFVWAYSDWVCSNRDGCGGGTASRNATCTLTATWQPVTSLHGSLCDEAQLDKSTQPCAQSPCLVYYWRTRELADCLPEDAMQPCGRYLQRRGFDCVNITTGEAVPNINCNDAKPVLGEVECTRPPEVDCSQGNAAALAAAEAAAAVILAPPAPGPDSDSSTSDDSGPTQVQLAEADGGSSSSTATVANSSSSTPLPGSSPAAKVGSAAAGGNAAAEASGSTDASGNSTSSDGPSAPGSSAGSSSDVAVSAGSNPTSSSGVPQASSSSTNDASGLGPGSSLPAWLLDKPTPTLQALLDCPLGLAMSADGRCCNGSFINAKGICCEDGGVDACGDCGGAGKAIDALGACCTGLLDAQGVCCKGPLDECGVCNGTNACDLKADLVVAVSPAVLYLVPASNANRRLKAALQDDVVAALTAVTGRAVEKARLGVVLSAYSPAAPGGSISGTAQHSAIAAVEATEEQLGGNGTASSDSTDSSSSGSGTAPPRNPSSTPPVAALPAMGGSSPDSMPMQADALITEAPQQLDAPTTHANLAPQPAPTVEPPLPPSSAVLRRLRSLATDALDAAPQQLGSRQLLQEGLDAGGATAGLSSSNALVVSITLRAPAAGSGADTGSTLLALQGLEGRQLAVPGARSKLTYSQVVSVVRAGTCGDGVCQVNGRLSWNNADSCQADCALPFLSCPPFEPGLPACNGLGVCYNSLGSCACTKGYAGPDCSRCAADYKRVGGFCVAAAALAPTRTCVGAACSGNVTTGLPLVSMAPRSLVGGQAAVATVVLATMVLVLCAALHVHRARWRRLLADHEAAVIKEAGTYVAG